MRYMRSSFLRSCIALLLGMTDPSNLLGAELSLLQGIYSSSTYKAPSGDTLSDQSIGAGGQYSDHVTGTLMWYGRALFASHSYSGDNAPSSTHDLTIGGGVRYFGERLSTRLVPYLAAGGSYKNETVLASATSQTKISGLFYHGAFGMRLAVVQRFYVDIESQLFENPLMSSEVTEDIKTGKTLSETKKTALLVDSEGPATAFTVGLGLVL